MLDELQLGYIGEKGNDKHEAIFDLLPLEGKISTVARLEEGMKFAKFETNQVTHLEVEFETPHEDVYEQSFNELITIKYHDLAHKYVYQDTELVSATSYIKRWIEPFNKEVISEICAKKYGCTQKEVLGLWEGGGDISGRFGTAVHNAIEHYEKYKELGAIIQKQKGGEFNAALPSHPALRNIVEEFYELDLREGKVVTEALLTNVERGLCGRADRILITGEKTCRVQDYKINIDAPVESSNNKYLGIMAGLPKNKLSKYQMQLSFYARLLALSGWTVEGLDIFVYENEWKVYTMGVLPLDF